MPAERLSQPAVFISHGPGPKWILDVKKHGAGLSSDTETHSDCARYLSGLKNVLDVDANPPKALLVVSAHHWQREFSVICKPRNSLHYDYYGCPPEAYNLNWSPAGSPQLAAHAKDLIQKAGLTCSLDHMRGLDHGVFVPLMLAFPKADIPVFQVSMTSSFSVVDHIKLGQALAPLRDNGVLIVGSGQASHNHSDGHLEDWIIDFKDVLNDAVCSTKYSRKEREAKIAACEKWPNFQKAHPSISHFLPLVVAMASAGFASGTKLFEQLIDGSLLIAHYKFKDK